jgi:hypothetical protein
MRATMIISKLTSINKLVIRNDELFVAAGGFEERACKFPQILELPNSASNTAVLLNYLPYKPENRFEEIQSSLDDKGCKVVPVEYNLHAPFNFDTCFKDILISSQAKAICLDISGMSRLAIMIILDVVHELNLSLRIVYAEAREYAPSKAEFEAAKEKSEQHLPTSFIHTGVYDVLHVSRLSSIRMQNQATLLIAFDSFNEALCQALVNVINPSRFILINGRPPREELKWREEATAYVHKNLRQEWAIEDDNNPIKVTSTLYYNETYELLTTLYWKFSGTHRIILAPTGSKMQTTGSYLLRAIHNDVHIEYPTVQGFFADKYSTDIREIWQLDVGKVGDFVESLRQKEIKKHLGLPEKLVDADID